MQSSESREKFDALHQAWWDVFFVSRVRVVWESNFGTSFVLGAPGARKGTWKELARIDWMRGTVKDDKLNACWEEVFLNVLAFQELAKDSFLLNTNSRGNVVEACGRELLGGSRARSPSRARSLWRDDPEVPFQNGASRGAGTSCCYLPPLRAPRRELASIEASRRL